MFHQVIAKTSSFQHLWHGLAAITPRNRLEAQLNCLKLFGERIMP